MMTDGINRGLVTRRDSSSDGFYGFRKMFWKFLKKLNVAFFDPCCSDASSSENRPVRYNEVAGRLEFHNGTDWVAAP